MQTLQALTQYYGSYDEDMIGYSNHTLDIFRKD